MSNMRELCGGKKPCWRVTACMQPQKSKHEKTRLGKLVYWLKRKTVIRKRRKNWRREPNLRPPQPSVLSKVQPQCIISTLYKHVTHTFAYAASQVIAIPQVWSAVSWFEARCSDFKITIQLFERWARRIASDVISRTNWLRCRRYSTMSLLYVLSETAFL